MDETIFEEPTGRESKQLRDAIRQSLMQIQELRERMKLDQQDIDLSRARTEAMLARLKAR